MHLEEEKLERLLSGELPEHEMLAVRDHVGQCRECGDALEAARRANGIVASLLESLDHCAPDIDAGQLARRARWRVLKPRLAAAGIALLVFCGAAAAMPGSPVRSWLSRAIGGIGSTQTSSHEPRATQPPVGISVIPTQEFELVFEAVQEAGRLRIMLSDQQEVDVRSDSDGVGYSVEPHGVRVLNSGSAANYDIVIPLVAESIKIRVGETTILEIRRGAVVVPATDAAASDFVFEFAALLP